MPRFSPKQRRVLEWWRKEEYDAVICDGAIRSGKTFALSVSFFLWAMSRFQRQRFALCAGSINGVRRTLLAQARPVLEGLGFHWEETVSRNEVTVRGGGRENLFYLYGGRDEGSCASIQGTTLAGVLLDEAALMPRSFVEQACARCSVQGGKLWFSCNPAGPEHWFYREWICEAEKKRALHLRFTMEDNPALSRGIRERYERMFQGAFYRRYVLGEWMPVSTISAITRGSSSSNTASLAEQSTPKRIHLRYPLVYGQSFFIIVCLPRFPVFRSCGRAYPAEPLLPPL